MYAIIETGGKQLRVEPGRFYDVDRLAVDEAGKVSIDKVLYIQSDDEVHVGRPLVSGAIVEGTVMRHLRGRKIIVYKMRPKKKTRKKQGHRQELTRLMIDSINVGGVELGRSSESELEAVAATSEPEAVAIVPAIESELEPIAATPEPEFEPVSATTETEPEAVTPEAESEEAESETEADELPE